MSEIDLATMTTGEQRDVLVTFIRSLGGRATTREICDRFKQHRKRVASLIRAEPRIRRAIAGGGAGGEFARSTVWELVRNDTLIWKKTPWGMEAILADFSGGDGVRFSLEHVPTCYRRGPWKLYVEVTSSPNHHKWGCFDDADQPTRWYHRRSNAVDEAALIAEVLWKDRMEHGPIGGVS